MAFLLGRDEDADTQRERAVRKQKGPREVSAVYTLTCDLQNGETTLKASVGCFDGGPRSLVPLSFGTLWESCSHQNTAHCSACSVVKVLL